QLRLAARHAAEADAVWLRLRVESGWERRVVGSARRRAATAGSGSGSVGYEPERDDHRGITRLRGNRRTVRRGEENRVEPLGLHDPVHAGRAAQPHVLRAIGLVSRAILLEVHLVRDVEVRLAVLDRTGLLMGGIPGDQIFQRFQRRSRTEAVEPLVEVALHSVFEVDRAVLVLAASVVDAAAGVPQHEIVLRILVDHARDIRRIDNDGAALFQDGDRVVHHPSLRVVQPTPGILFAGWRDAVVEEGARDADARAFQAVAIEKLRVVAAGRRRAGPRRRIVRIGSGTFEDTEHDRDIANALGHRTGGILIRGDRDHAVAADAADRWFDAGPHVLVRRAHHRTRGLCADIAVP